MAERRPLRSGVPRKQGRSEGGVVWNALATVSFIASVIIFVGLSLHTWRVNEPISYHYMSGRVVARDSFASSSYGLYMISFNGGAVTKNWNRLMNQICTGIDAQAPISAGMEIIGRSGCGSTCVSHFRTRCGVYSKMQFWGFLTLGTLILTASLGLVAGAWVMLFGVHRVVLQLLWTCMAALALAVIGFWTMETNNLFHTLAVDSQFPYPSLSTAFYISFVGVSALFLCGVLALFIAYLNDRAETAARQKEIDERILAQTSPNDPFGGGLFMGMPFPAGVSGPPLSGPPRSMNRPPPPGMWAPAPQQQSAPPLPPMGVSMPPSAGIRPRY